MKVFSMFDGVGGFIIGLNNADKNFYETIVSNQYEPSTKSQDAYEVGVYRFPDIEHIPTDVTQIPDSKFKDIKNSGVELIVGGFPCQDYSVARSKKNEMGIEGQKGVLFWEIIRATKIIEPKYLILENVDRLLKAPSKQRGRDFAVMLAAFNQLGYSVEWRVINAADYGRAQRRRRVFFFVFRNDTGWAKHLDNVYETLHVNEDVTTNFNDYIFNTGLFARQFPIQKEPIKNRLDFDKLENDIATVSDTFSNGKFWNTGIMRHGYYYTSDTLPQDCDTPITLGEILQNDSEVDQSFYLTKEQIKKFEYLRGSKKIERTSADGHKYFYSEGGMSPYDSLDLPGRTMLTSEGTVNRSTHIVKQNNKLRFLTPIETERLQDFPDDWTKYKKTEEGNIEQVSNRKRMFFMGNALVTGIVKRIGIELKKIDTEY